MTQFTDEQLKTFYTQVELVALIEAKAVSAQVTLPTGYNYATKPELVAIARELDVAMQEPEQTPLGSRIESNRRHMKLSTIGASQLLSVSRMTLYRWETSKVLPNYENFLKLKAHNLLDD